LYNRFEQCGLKDFELTDENRDIFRNVMSKFPTIYDAAGMGDDDSVNVKEILELILGGILS